MNAIPCCRGFISAFVLLFLNAGAAAQSLPNSSDVPIKECYVDGHSELLTCGKLTVPENYDKPDGKKIDIHYAIIPAIKPLTKNEAFLAISGGPGQSAIESTASFAKTFSRVRQTRDILLIDQRGTGDSSPMPCEEDYENPLALNDETMDYAKLNKECRDAQTQDVQQYGSIIALRDHEEVRKALGYDKLHVYGISYGTRMAQLYMRHYPEALATVTLDGVVPMQDSVIGVSAAVDRALELMLKGCEENEQCQQTFPTLRTDFSELLTQLSDAPVSTTVMHPTYATQTELLLTRSKFLGSIRMALYSPNIRVLVPLAITQAAKGNYAPFLGLNAIASGGGINMGMHLAVVCGGDWTRLDEQKRQSINESSIGEQMLTLFDTGCPLWDMPAVDADFSKPIESDIPTLLLSGELDPATPPAWAEMAMEKLANAKHLVSPYATHGVAMQSCAPKIIAEFVNTSTLEELDYVCMEEDNHRDFYLNANSVVAMPVQGEK